MNKKLIALAVAAVALPLSAQAEVTIYGQLHTSIDYIDADVAPDSYVDVTSRASRIGFKGSEDLGDGLSFVWQAETTYNMAEGGWSSGRNAFVGLAGGWGTFLYGRHDTPYKMSTGKLDIFSDTLADYNAGNGLSAGGVNVWNNSGLTDMRASDAIAYVSPNMGGLTLAGAIVPDGDYDGTGDVAGAYSLAAMYSNGGLFLAGAYESGGDLVGDVDHARWRVGGGFDMDAFHIGAVYENEQADDFDVDFDKIYVSGSFKFGNNAVKAMWMNVDGDDVGGVSVDNDTWAIGLDHNFSKRTKLYALYADGDGNLQDTNYRGEQDGFSVGMIHKF